MSAASFCIPTQSLNADPPAPPTFSFNSPSSPRQPTLQCRADLCLSQSEILGPGNFAERSQKSPVLFIFSIRADLDLTAATSHCPQTRLPTLSQNLALALLHSAFAQLDFARGQIETKANLVIHSVQVASPMLIASFSLTDAFSSRLSRIHQSPSAASRVSYLPCLSTCRSSSAPMPGPNGSQSLRSSTPSTNFP